MPLDDMRARFSEEYGVKFDVVTDEGVDVGTDEGVGVPKDADLSNDEYRSLSNDGIKSSELDRWRAYGAGKGELP